MGHEICLNHAIMTYNLRKKLDLASTSQYAVVVTLFMAVIKSTLQGQYCKIGEDCPSTCDIMTVYFFLSLHYRMPFLMLTAT